MRDQTILVLIAVFAAVIFVGQAMTYGSNPYSNDADAWVDEYGTVGYAVRSNTSNEFTVVLLDNNSLYDIRELMIYWDETYAMGNSKEYLESKKNQIISEINIRNSVTVKEADANQLRSMMLHESLGTEEKNKTALLMLTGAFPRTVYDGTEDSVVLSWLAGGGVLYWIGPPIGKFIADLGESKPEFVTGFGKLFFGVDSDDVVRYKPPGIPSEPGTVFYSYAVDPSRDINIASAIGVYYNTIKYGLDISELTDYKSIGYTGSGYDSAVLLKFHKGTGMIAIFGGDPTADSAPQLAQVISAKLNYKTEIVDINVSHIHNGISTGNFLKHQGSNADVYIFIGAPMVFYAEFFDLSRTMK
ncbi:MAG: hypothetical protein LBM39_03225 [Candidatus Methanoplasma sp.]|nr:hypothetical protein [Candidatus Methanoplasma sp.]